MKDKEQKPKPQVSQPPPRPPRGPGVIAGCGDDGDSDHPKRKKEIVMATPELTMTDWDVSRRTPFDFAGRVQISIESQPVAEFEIDAQRTRQCNWLQTQGIPVGFILSDHLYTNYPGLQRYLTPGSTHHITFTFQRTPATNASIWMTWLERYEDFRRN